MNWGNSPPASTARSILDRLTPFGDLGELTSTDVLAGADQDALAHAVHDTYRAGGAGAPPSPEANRHVGSRLPEYLKQSNRAFADHIAVKLGSRADAPRRPAAAMQIELTEAMKSR